MALVESSVKNPTEILQYAWSNGAPQGISEWQNLNNILSNDSAYASVQFLDYPNRYSKRLHAIYDFSEIPDDAIIEGIVTEVDKYQPDSNYGPNWVTDFGIYWGTLTITEHYNDGETPASGVLSTDYSFAPATANYSKSETWPTTETTSTYGSSTTPVGFTGADLKLDTNELVDIGDETVGVRTVFGFCFACQSAFVDDLAYIDNIRVVVHYINEAPGITSVTINPNPVIAGGAATLTVNAFDAENDTLSYSYAVSGGSIESQDDNTAVWRAPTTAGEYTITITVDDGYNTPISETITITVENSTVTPTIPKQLDIRIYDANGLRKTFPSHNIDSVSWELIEAGYYGSSTITLKNSFDNGILLNGNDRVDILVDNVLRYRGYIGTPEDLLNAIEQKSLSAYGLAERLNSIRIDRKYVVPNGADVSEFFAQIVSDYIAPRIANLETDIEVVGYEIETLSLNGTTARDAMSTLIDQTAKRAVWGFDVNPATGANRIFLRVKSTESKYKLAIGGKLKSFSYPPDYTEIVNNVHLVGAEADYPNMLSNAGFDEPKPADENDGNLISNGGFESSTLGEITDPVVLYWNFSDGASRKEEFVRTGKYCALLDHPGEYIQQDDRSIHENYEYKLNVWYLTPSESKFRLEVLCYNSSDTLLSTISETLTGTDIDYGAYRKASMTFTPPAGTAYGSIKIIGDTPCPECRIDDISLYRTDAVVQKDWWIYRSGTDVLSMTNWVYDDDAYHGAYAVRRTVTSVPVGGYTNILSKWVSVEKEHTYQSSCRVKNLGATAINVYPVLWVADTNNNTSYVVGSAVSIAPGDWTLVSWGASGWTSADDQKQVMVGLRVTSVCDILIDAMMFTEFNMLDQYAASFIPSKNYEFDLSTDDAFVQTDTALPDIVKNSITLYGIREAESSVDTIDSLTLAQNWAIGYFGSKAQPVISNRLEVAGYNDIIAPDGLVKLLNTDIEPAFPARISYSLGGDGLLNISADLGTERASFEGLLQSVLNKAKIAISKK